MTPISAVRRPRRTAGRALALVVVAALATTTPPAQAGGIRPDGLSSQWLGDQLTSGIVHNDEHDFDDYGLTIDTGLGLSAIGTTPSTVAEIDAALRPHVDSYTTGVDWGNDDVYAGATAKAVTFATQIGADPTSYGGANLVRRLNGRVLKSGPSKGRIRDRSSADYANVIGQALAVQGLGATTSGQRGATLRFLRKQQCEQGYFRLNFTKRKAARNQKCDGGNPKTISAPDTDTTALALLSLVSLDSDRPGVKRTITKAKRWLKRRQKANGSFGGGTSTEGSNANSTGLAGWALAATHTCGAAADAAEWVHSLQLDSGVVAGEDGGIAYNRVAYAAALSGGITVPARDQWRRATAQAAPALRYLQVADCRLR